MGGGWSSLRHDAGSRLADVDWRTVLLDLVVGPRSRTQAVCYVVLPVVLLAGTAVAYGTGVYDPGGRGCLLIYPGLAATLGVALAFAVGVGRRGWLLAFASTHGAAFGYQLATAATDYAGWGLAPQLRVLVRLDAHLWFGVVGAILVTGPFVAGAVLRAAVAAVHRNGIGALDGR